MKRILVTGAGGSPAANFVRSLRKAPEPFHIVGTDADKYYLMRAEVDRRYLVPAATDASFLEVLNRVVEREDVDFVHAQNDAEVAFFSENRDKISARTFLPKKETVRVCHNKFVSYEKWRASGLKVPTTVSIANESDLRAAFERLGGVSG